MLPGMVPVIAGSVPSYDTPVLIPGGTGSTIHTGFGIDTAKAFDGVAPNTSANSARGTAGTNNYLGKSLGASYRIYSAKTWGGTTEGYWGGSSAQSVTIELRASNSAPSSGADGTLLGSVTFTDPDNAAPGSDPQTILSSDTSSLWTYVWVRVNAPSGQFNWLSEVEFYEAT